MTQTFKGFQINYKNGGAILYKKSKFIKAFASDETKNGKSGITKAKEFVNNLNNKQNGI